VIWYHSKQQDMAWLDDRRQTLDSFGNLAGSLCVRLAVSSPKHLLDAERHNTLVPPTLHWTDLMNLTYIHDKMMKVLLLCFGKFGMHNNNCIHKNLTITPTLLLDNQKTCSLLSYGLEQEWHRTLCLGCMRFIMTCCCQGSVEQVADY
jgi:hypothetical protein